MFHDARKRAAKTGLEFSICVFDFVVPKHCPVLGIELQYGVGYRNDSSPSLDRIDSTKGYVPGNVLVISWRANRLKSDATLSELRLIAAYMERELQ